MAYAADVDTKPWNAYYERPATLSLLPKLDGVVVLDAGCGSGWYSEQFLSQGATVTAVDFNQEFVSLTKSRVGSRARVLQANLAGRLKFASDGEFDLIVSPLVMHYIRDWQPVFSEFRRILKPEGLLVFSTHHPFMDWKYFNRENYFATELLEDDWGIGKLQFYRRPLTNISADLQAAGFVIERLLEPEPKPEFQRALPEAYKRLVLNPQFLVIRARANFLAQAGEPTVSAAAS